jgi:D-alanine-D-alanine ligase
MSRKSTRVLVLAGGASGEHSISLRSAATVVAALGEAGHETTVVGITPGGRWLLGDFRSLLERAKTDLVEVPADAGRQVTIVNDGVGPRLLALDARPINAREAAFDVVFPVLHGPGGEDGTVQGLFDLTGAAYVGAGCTASALAMDKLAMKYACAGAGIPQVDFLAANDDAADALTRRIDATFGFPCFVKPANLGSSVGITHVLRAADLGAALAEARRWDDRVIVERAVAAREIEVALLGNEKPEISPPGEIVPKKGFYDFASKYCDDAAADLVAPAPLDVATLDHIRSVALEVWQLIGGRGLARADFFVERSTGRVLFNEINTMPGMTRISMYPRLWALAGVDTAHLCDRLVRLALARTSHAAASGLAERRRA